MANNLLKLKVATPPTLCKDFTELHQNIKQLNSSNIGLVLLEVKSLAIDPICLVFAPLDASGHPDISKAVGFQLPCPPYCQGDVSTPTNSLAAILVS